MKGPATIANSMAVAPFSSPFNRAILRSERMNVRRRRAMLQASIPIRLTDAALLDHGARIIGQSEANMCKQLVYNSACGVFWLITR
jgi:hypothetical protein